MNVFFTQQLMQKQSVRCEPLSEGSSVWLAVALSDAPATL